MVVKLLAFRIPIFLLRVEKNYCFQRPRSCHCEAPRAVAIRSPYSFRVISPIHRTVLAFSSPKTNAAHPAPIYGRMGVFVALCPLFISHFFKMG